MKRKLLLMSTLILGIIFQTLTAQVTPVASTVDSPTWYYIESAAVTSLGTPNSTLTSILPLKDKGYVAYSPAVAGNIKYRITTGADDEKWAIVTISGVQYLKNKGTGFFMNASRAVGSTANDAFIFTSLGSGQYTLRNNSQASVMIAWNSLTCDRWNSNALNTNTAWIFKSVDSSEKGNLKSAIDAANAAKLAGVSEDPGFVSATSQSAIDFSNAIAAAQTVYNSTVTDAEYAAAKTTLEAAVTTFTAAPKNPIVLSANGVDTWYYIVNGSDVAYCSGKAIVNRSATTGTALQFATKMADPNMLWKFVDAGNGKYGIQNRASGKFIATTISAGTQDAIGAYGITSVNSNGRFKINSGAGDLHAQDAGSTIVTWNEDGTYRSTWKFNKISDADAATPVSVSSLNVQQGRLTTGIGNTNFPVVFFSTDVSGFVGEAFLESVKVNLAGTTDLNDIENIRIYQLPASMKFSEQTATLVANGTVGSGDQTITLTSPLKLLSGSNYFCVVVDVKQTAKEGNLIDASVVSVKQKGLPEKLAIAASPANSATIFLTESRLFTPGDYNSVSYRIPSIVTAKDGSLITSTDKRNNHSGDLAADIDQYVRRSTDNGKTWSDVVMTCGAGTTLGYGDPALVVDRVTGKIICLVVHDKGFFGSTAAAPIKVIMLESDDNGITWSAPKDITDQLYGANCTNPLTQNWAGIFISSGRGLQLRSGRIMFAGVVRNGSSSNLQVHSVYTDDLGKTWNVSTNSAVNGGDESKFAERNNGDVVVSIRNAGKREWNVSTDKGMTWGTTTNHADLTDPNCNGEIMTYTSTKDGFDKNRMLHSLCYSSSRTNVSMLLSYDEGVTFPTRKTICAASSAYSTFTVLQDGTIGMYFEDGSIGNTYDMVFVRFSLDWLTGGADSYKPVITGVNQAVKKNIQARVDNGYVIVSGSDAAFRVYNSSGVEVSKKSKLKSGVYIVKVEEQAIKLIVK